MISFNANALVCTENAAGHGVGGSLKSAIGTFTLAGALVAGQKIPMLAVPTGARILDVHIASDKLDNGSGLTFDVGDKLQEDRYFSSSDVAQNGGVKRLDTASAIAYRYEKAATVDLVVKTVPANQAAGGKIRLTVFYVID